jgi:hypothetical protein
MFHDSILFCNHRTSTIRTTSVDSGILRMSVIDMYLRPYILLCGHLLTHGGKLRLSVNSDQNALFVKCINFVVFIALQNKKQPSVES